MLLMLALWSASAWPGPARAVEHASGRNVLVPSSRIVNDDLMVAGNSVLVASRVNGEVAAAGNNVTVSGPVQHDVMAAGQEVAINGPVGDDLRAAGANVTVNAPVTDNATLAGGTVILSPAASVGRNAHILGGSVQVQGRVGHNLTVSANQAQLASTVNGSVQARANRLTLLPGALVRGNLMVEGPNAPEISPQAKVLGNVTYHKTSVEQKGSRLLGWLEGWGFQFLALLILGAALFWLARPWADRVVETMTRQAGLSALTGILGLILIPVVSVLLFITLIGLPLGVTLLALYGAALLLAGVFVAYLIGGWLLRGGGRSQASPFARFALGALVLSFCTSLPWIGWLVLLIVLILGLGAVVVREWDVLSRLRTGAAA